MSTAFDDVVDAFKAVLQQNPAVCPVVESDQVDQIPEDVAQAVEVEWVGAVPQEAGIEGQPVEWNARVRVGLYARKSGSSARADAGTLLAAVFARLAANTDLGLGDAVYIYPPTLDASAARQGDRMAGVDMLYPVRVRTEGLTLDVA